MKSTVKDIMTTHAVAVGKSTSFKQMATRICEDRVSAFPVVDDDGKVVGVVSEGGYRGPGGRGQSGGKLAGTSKALSRGSG